MEKCIGSGCNQPVRAKKMCTTHYERARRSGDARLDVPARAIPKKRGSPVCTIGDCSAPVHGRGLCNTHYMRQFRTGSTSDPEPPREGCDWPEGCDRPHWGLGLCHTHYARHHQRRRYLQHHYKITEVEYEERFDAQGRRCPVCFTDRPRGDARWHVHHNHYCCPGDRSCGSCIIAILCGPCNIGMGGLEDDPDRLERVAALMRGVLTNAPVSASP